MKLTTLDNLLNAKSRLQPSVLVTDLADGDQTLWSEFANLSDQDLAPELVDACREVLRLDKSRQLEMEDHRYFLQVHNPPKRLFVIGAVHISQFLAPMAAMAGYQVIVIDPRGAWATEERFPGIRLDKRWPDEALEDLSPNSRTAIVTLTHDPKLDDPALEIALKSDAFYIGALGSKKTQAARVQRLTELGYSSVQIDRIAGPVGLDIGAVSPAEISISIMAQITLALHGPRR